MRNCAVCRWAVWASPSMMECDLRRVLVLRSHTCKRFENEPGAAG
jgi:hypothetical protein